MRKIKFRGKSLRTGDWVFGFFSQVIGRSFICVPKEAESTFLFIEVVPESVGQYIGHEDCNGVEIYEGDIVKHRYYPLGANPKIIEYYYIGIVICEKNKFGVQLKIDGSNILDEEKKLSFHKTKKETYKHPTCGADYIDHHFSFSKSEVIGNTTDNPELTNKN